MYTKVIYLVVCYIISISRENIDFVHPLKFHIVINIKKKLTFYKINAAFRFLNFNTF